MASIGQIVKILRNDESFWVELTLKEWEPWLYGRADHWLVNDHGYDYGDTVEFNEDEIVCSNDPLDSNGGGPPEN